MLEEVHEEIHQFEEAVAEPGRGWVCRSWSSRRPHRDARAKDEGRPVYAEGKGDPLAPAREPPPRSNSPARTTPPRIHAPSRPKAPTPDLRPPPEPRVDPLMIDKRESSLDGASTLFNF